MLNPLSKVCLLCNGRFRANLHERMICNECLEGLLSEHLGIPLKLTVSNRTENWRNLFLVTNKAGHKARVHVIRKRDLLRPSDVPAKAICNSALRQVNRVRPLVQESVGDPIKTHSDSETRFCTTCEKLLRKESAGIRSHRFIPFEFAGHVGILMEEPPS